MEATALVDAADLLRALYFSLRKVSGRVCATSALFAISQRLAIQPRDWLLPM